jgi:hypothetical protein
MRKYVPHRSILLHAVYLTGHLGYKHMWVLLLAMSK